MDNKDFSVIYDSKGNAHYTIVLEPGAPSYEVWCQKGGKMTGRSFEERRLVFLEAFAAWKSLTPTPYEKIAHIKIHYDDEGGMTYYETRKDGAATFYICDDKGEKTYGYTAAESRDLQREFNWWRSLTPEERDAEVDKLIEEEFGQVRQTPR